MRIFCFILVLLLARFEAAAMFMIHETTNVPIARVFTNLQQRLATNASDYQLHYQLARLHAMAASTNLSEVRVQEDDAAVQFGYPGSDNGTPEPRSRSYMAKTNAPVGAKHLGHLTNAIAHYEVAIKLMKKSTNADEVRWLILPTQLGYAWCLEKAGRRQEALDGYRKVLAMAWRQEVMGDFNLDEWVKGVWSDVQSLKNPIHARSRGYIGPGVCFSEESIGYLLRLLDPVKDAGEIADLKDRQQKLQSMGRAVTPILIPLADLPLEELVDSHAQVSFDLDGSGLPRRWGWITPNAAWLVYDADAQGRITSGLQLFGSVTFWIFWRDGYQALGSLDDNGDGLLKGNELRGLALWRDVNSNGRSESGEVRPLSEWGVQQLNCCNEPLAPGVRWSARGVQLTNGVVRPSYDWSAPLNGVEIAE